MDLRRYRAELLLNRDDDIPLRGAFTQVDTILTRRAPYLRFWASSRTSNALAALLLVVGCTIFSLRASALARVIQEVFTGKASEVHLTGLQLSDLFVLPFSATYLMYSVWFFITRAQYCSVIYLQTWRERTTFWERNKEEMLREIIVGVVVAIVTFIFGYIVGAQH